jgi:uncharacterized protein (TIGR02118 family)
VVKLVAFFKRKPGMPVDAFQEHWRTTHAALVVAQAGLRRYVQNHSLLDDYPTAEPDYDGVAEAWFDSVDDMRALASSSAYTAVREDEANFIDATSMGVLLSDEIVIVDGPVRGLEQGSVAGQSSTEIKLIAFLRRRADLAPAAFHSYWREHHGQLAARIPGHRRYVQCHARPGIYASGRTPVFDGIPMSWFESVEALRVSHRSSEFKAVRADEANFLAPGPLPFVVAREVQIEV